MSDLWAFFQTWKLSLMYHDRLHTLHSAQNWTFFVRMGTQGNCETATVVTPAFAFAHTWPLADLARKGKVDSRRLRTVLTKIATIG